MESRGPSVAIGDFCEVRTANGTAHPHPGDRLPQRRVLSMPLEEIDGLQLGDSLSARSEDARVEVGPGLLGRVIDGFGKPMDDGPAIEVARYLQPSRRRHRTRWTASTSRSRWSPASAPSTACCPAAKGQRIGIFGGSGVGKSTLLGSMSRHNSADVTVIALIGERNREVRGFLEHELGPEGRKRSVVVCATSRPSGAAARPRLLRRAGGRRIFPRSGRQRAAGDGFGDPPGHGAARDRPGRRRTAQPERLHAFGLQPAAQGARAGRKFRTRLDHRLLHRAGGRRRFQRADLRCGARHSGRPHHSLAATRRAGPLSGHRHSALRQPADQRHRHARRRRRPRARFAGRWPLIAMPRT